MRVFAYGILICALSAGAALCAFPLAGAAPAPAPVPSPPGLAGHRALYAITLSDSHAGGTYVSVSGKMYFEFTDACGSWATSQKFMLQTYDTDGKVGHTDSDYSAVEDKTADNFTFTVRKTQDGETETVRGNAKRNGADGAGVAEFSKPEHKLFKLPAHFLFPTEQTVKLIEHAQKGNRFFADAMFDGTQEGGSAQFNALLLKPAKAPDDLMLKSALLKAPAHLVHIAFFPAAGVPSGNGGQAVADAVTQPDYEQTMTLHDNGVISDMDVDMGDYAVHYRLQAIEALPRPHC